VDGSFADTDVLANADFDTLVCEGTREGRGLWGRVSRGKEKGKEKQRENMPSIPGNFFAV